MNQPRLRRSDRLLRLLSSYDDVVIVAHDNPDPDAMASYHPDTRDTVIGNDVWLGYDALIMPGEQERTTDLRGEPLPGMEDDDAE